MRYLILLLLLIPTVQATCNASGDISCLNFEAMEYENYAINLCIGHGENCTEYMYNESIEVNSSNDYIASIIPKNISSSRDIVNELSVYTVWYNLIVMLIVIFIFIGLIKVVVG